MCDVKKMDGKQDALNRIVLALSLICFFRIFMLDFFSTQNNIISLVLAVVSAAVVLYGIWLIKNSIERHLKVLWLGILFIFSIVFLIHKSGFEYICNTITVLGVLTVLPKVNIKKQFLYFYIIVFTVYSVLIALFAPKLGSAPSTIIHVNTNGSSYVMFYLFYIMLVFASKSKYKIIPSLVCVLAVGFQFLFGGRSVLIGTAVILIYVLFRKNFDKLRKKTVRNLSFFICILGIAFAYFYAIVLYNKVGYGTIKIFGKDIFTGRHIIWQAAFDCLQGHFLFGIGNTLTAGNYPGVVNVHNQMLGFLTCFGSITTILIILLIGFLIAEFFKRKQTNFCVAFVMTVIIMSYFETIFYASVNSVLFIVAFIIVSALELTNIKERSGNGDSLLLARRSGKVR